MAEQDILFNDNNDLMFIDGDLVIGESDEQHISHLLIATPGEYKSNPLLGCAIQKKLNGNLGDSLIRNINIQLKMDGFTINALEISEEELTIDATR